ncbi:MAG: DUF3291 domain-containing protein [Betaproteobacteria bacterium]
MADFVAALDPVNAAAERAAGFCWRLKTEDVALTDAAAPRRHPVLLTRPRADPSVADKTFGCVTARQGSSQARWPAPVGSRQRPRASRRPRVRVRPDAPPYHESAPRDRSEPAPGPGSLSSRRGTPQ